eukprot:NODE_362_length_10118_cov_0.149117.p5 type:complete len:152 gc:universal NODE_362_length_10118_cov_0.149117:1841-2296(+)
MKYAILPKTLVVKSLFISSFKYALISSLLSISKMFNSSRPLLLLSLINMASHICHINGSSLTIIKLVFLYPHFISILYSLVYTLQYPFPLDMMFISSLICCALSILLSLFITPSFSVGIIYFHFKASYLDMYSLECLFLFIILLPFTKSRW